MSKVSCSSSEYSYTSVEDEDIKEPLNKNKSKLQEGLNNCNEIRKSVQELISDNESTSSEASLSSAGDINDDEEEKQYEDPDMNLILNALEKSVNNFGIKRQNKTFSDDKIRDIERTNSILMKRILSHSKRANMFTPAPRNKKISSSALNRKKQQRQIDHDNLILLRKIQTVKPIVVNHAKH
ncbi:hypothetical protein ILUMI_03789 [Ignelater luminosus]|uniref:Cilia- and flagella-associated protein 97-like n=1 Tax=Ignelater luminosus TaxID=2038154 RepID=A0A8K0DFX3_IGNLU|nr:hypothetical protein ILUMI_03789 [Ignelater luminosus]